MEADSRRPLFALLPLAAAALAIAGCGGGGSSAAAPGQSNTSTAATTGTATNTTSSSSHGALSKAAFIAQAEVICKRVNNEVISKSKSSSTREILRIAPPNAAVERRSVSELDRLRPPASFRRDWRRIFGYRRKLADELDALVRAAKRNDTANVKRLIGAKREAHALMYEYALKAHFKACADVG